MNKNFKLIIILIVLILLVAGGVFFLMQDSEIDVPNIPVESGDKTPGTTRNPKDIVVQDVKVENVTDNRYVSCLYPRVVSLTDGEFQNYINTQIATNINEYRAEIEYIIDEETKPTEIYRYVTKYDRYNAKIKYLSLVIDQDYQTGGIRSNKWKDIYNINVETERIVYLNDLFDAGVKYEEAIIAEIEKQAATKNYEMMGGNGLTKLSTKQKFYIKDDKLIIYFDPSEAAAAVFGELHFEMPFTLNENGFFEINQNSEI